MMEGYYQQHPGHPAMGMAMQHQQPQARGMYQQHTGHAAMEHQQPQARAPPVAAAMPRAKSDKPRGRMSSYAYFVQTCREEHRKKHPNETIDFAAFSRKCSDRWKVMSDKEKKRFVDMAEQDKQRYEAEMQHYVPPPGTKKGRGKKKAKDPNAPKRALSAFFWFCNDERPKVRQMHPDYSVGDVAKVLGKQWGEVDAATKQRYEQMAEKDKERYEREMANYRAGASGSAQHYDDDEGDE